MESELREYRWRRLGLVSAAIRLALAAGPAAIVAGFGLLLLRYTPRSGGHLNAASWLLETILLSLVVLLAFEVLASRLRTLAALFDISMVHPYRPPSRAAVAMTSPYYLELTSELDGVRRHLRRARRGGEAAAAAAEHLDRVESILTLAALTGSLEPATRRHSRRVAQLADRLAVVLGLDRQERRWLRWAALLHDVGKLAVPDEILEKPTRLSAAEREIIRRHVTNGARMISPLQPLLGPWGRAVSEHHERWDGAGYPLGLRGEEISLAGRIVAVADTYATMTKGRAYQRRVQPLAALAELERQAGGQFDPSVVAAFAVSWRRRRSLALLVGLPRSAALAAASIWATLGLPTASMTAVVGVGSAVAVVAITAPAVARVLPPASQGPIASLETVLGVPPVSSPQAAPPATRVTAPSPRTAATSLPRPPTAAPPALALAAPAPVAAPAPTAGAPVIRLPSTTTATEGVLVAVDGFVTAPDGSAPTVAVDYGDGSPPQSVSVSSGYFRLSHIYVDEGSASIVVSASTSRSTSRAISQLTISEYQAKVDLPSGVEAPGGSFALGGDVVDPSADTEFATVDYGDGTVQPLDIAGRNFQLRHTYPQASGSPSTYTVRVAFRDDEGAGPTAIVTVSVTPTTTP